MTSKQTKAIAALIVAVFGLLAAFCESPAPTEEAPPFPTLTVDAGTDAAYDAG